MSRYREIADDLRSQIQAGAYPLGSQLPTIAELQIQYDVRGLNTIRNAQQMLVEEGMLETRQGAGVFVISTVSRRQVDVVETIAKARDSLTTVLDVLATADHRVTFDLRDGETGDVLAAALREWALRLRDAAARDDKPTRRQRLRQAATAEALLERVEAAQ